MTCNARPHLCAQCGGELSAPSWGRYRALDMAGKPHACYEGEVPVPNEREFEKRAKKARGT